jgi:cyclase
MPFVRHHRLSLYLLAASAGCMAARGAEDPVPTAVRTEPVAGNVYTLTGAGGNVGLCVGDDGALLVDADYEARADNLLAAVKAAGKGPLRFVVNTHWHFDHVGGNEKLARAGALLIAHENVRTRMSTEQLIGHIDRRVPAAPAGALPVLTFSNTLTLHVNGEEVRIVHVEPAHTDGDSLVLFRNANVLQVGDIYFNGGYPFIDVRAGGSLDGMIRAIDQALALTNENTRIIPGHGRVSSVADFRAYREMLVTVRDRVRAMVKEGQTREAVIAAKPTRELDEKWGRGAFPPDPWVGIVYDGMTGK